MRSKNYILMKFQNERKLQAYYFCAVDEATVSKKIIYHLYRKDANFQKIFVAQGYSLEDGGFLGHVNILHQILTEINWTDESTENMRYQLFEIDTLSNETELKEVNLLIQKPNIIENGKYRKLQHLTQEGGSLEIIPNWKDKIVVSEFDLSESDFDRNWVNEIPRLQSLERARFKESLVSKKQKPITVSVYFQNNKPIYICRRSSSVIYFEWLIKVNTYCQEHYKTKIAIEERKKEQMLASLQQQEAVALEKEVKAKQKAEKIRQELENARANEIRKIALEKKINAINDEFLKQRAAQVNVFKQKLENEKKAIQEYYDACVVHQNEWLCGVGERAKNNKLAWELAEKEEMRYQNDRPHYSFILKKSKNTEYLIK